MYQKRWLLGFYFYIRCYIWYNHIYTWLYQVIVVCLFSQLNRRDAVSVDLDRRDRGYSAAYDFKPYQEGKFVKKSGDYLEFFLNSGRDFMFLTSAQQKNINELVMSEYVAWLFKNLK